MAFGHIPPENIFNLKVMRFVGAGLVRENLFGIMQQNHETMAVLKHFESLRGNSEKVKYTMRLLNDHHFILTDVLRISKSDEMSNKFRKSGNKCYAAKEYFNALELYNQSICFAEKGSENLSIGYANRSAVYFEWQLYKKCLENISLAKDANYPVRLMSKLEKRRIDCEECINAEMSDDVEAVVPKLSHPAHANNPFMANCVELKDNAKKGRHIVAKRDLKIGGIVILEKPFETRLRHEYRYRRCENCLGENKLTLIPCPRCTSAMYCSTQCLKTAHKKFHKYECPIVDIMPKLKFENVLYAARILLTMIHEFGGITELAAVVQELTDDDSISSLSQFYTAAGIGKREMLNFFHLLKDNSDIRPIDDLFNYAIMTGVLHDLFMKKTKLKKLLANHRDEDVFLNLLFKYVCICKSNSHSLTLFERSDDEDIHEEEFGAGILPISRFLKHSCYPNVDTNFNSMSQMVVAVSRPIKVGKQLLSTAGVNHLYIRKKDRIAILHKNIIMFANV